MVKNGMKQNGFAKNASKKNRIVIIMAGMTMLCVLGLAGCGKQASDGSNVPSVTASDAEQDDTLQSADQIAKDESQQSATDSGEIEESIKDSKDDSKQPGKDTDSQDENISDRNNDATDEKENNTKENDSEGSVGATGGKEDVSTVSEGDGTKVPMNQGNYTVWNVYWNLDGVPEQVERYAEHIVNVNFFGAYFDKDNALFIAPKTTEFYQQKAGNYGNRGWKRYLTFVNDKVNADGKSSLKSKDLLYAILDNEEKCRAHAEQVIALAKNNGYDGVEIDYENLRRDETLWQHFMRFIGILYTRCQQENLLLRVVIEPDIPAERIAWVSGPVYCMMCYNLYGSHSGPGPKADRQFLEGLMNNMSHVPGEVDYALANGGFDWGDDGSCKSLTVKAAQALVKEKGADVQTDPASGAKYYSYKDANGIGHQVWYGDDDTLNQWMSWLGEKGHYNYSIWRLGD